MCSWNSGDRRELLGKSSLCLVGRQKGEDEGQGAVVGENGRRAGETCRCSCRAGAGPFGRCSGRRVRHCGAAEACEASEGECRGSCSCSSRGRGTRCQLWHHIRQRGSGRRGIVVWCCGCSCWCSRRRRCTRPCGFCSSRHGGCSRCCLPCGWCSAGHSSRSWRVSGDRSDCKCRAAAKAATPRQPIWF